MRAPTQRELSHTIRTLDWLIAIVGEERAPEGMLKSLREARAMAAAVKEHSNGQ